MVTEILDNEVTYLKNANLTKVETLKYKYIVAEVFIKDPYIKKTMENNWYLTFYG